MWTPPSRQEWPKGQDASSLGMLLCKRAGGQPSSDSPEPSLRVELVSDLFVFQQVLLYCFKNQAEVITGLFREVTQGAPNQWFLRDSGCLLAGLCTMDQWQLISPVLFLCICLGTVDGGRQTVQGRGASGRRHLLGHSPLTSLGIRTF